MYVGLEILLSYNAHAYVPVQSTIFCSLKEMQCPVAMALAPSSAPRAPNAYDELHWPYKFVSIKPTIIIEIPPLIFFMQDCENGHLIFHWSHNMFTSPIQMRRMTCGQRFEGSHL